MPHSLVARLALSFLLFVCGLGLWKGRWPERTVSLVYLAQEAIYLALYDPTDQVNPQWAGFFLDLACLVVVAFVAVRSSRSWAKYITALQMLSVGAHLSLAIDLRFNTATAFWMVALLSIADLVLLLAGTIQVIVQDRRAKGQVLG